MSENDVICIVPLHHLSQFRRVKVRYNVRKELFPRLEGIVSLGKIPFLFPSKITINGIRNVIHVYAYIHKFLSTALDLLEVLCVVKIPFFSGYDNIKMASLQRKIVISLVLETVTKYITLKM